MVASFRMGGINFVAKRACRCGPPPEECVGDDEILTHYGHNGEFTPAPRESVQEREVSVLRGPYTAHEAARQVRGSRLSDAERSAASARYAHAGDLRDKGFAVVHTPGRVRNPGHVSIVWPADDPLNRQDIPWPQDVVTAFNGCFNDSVEGTDR